jgi:hypothetical protein
MKSGVCREDKGVTEDRGYISMEEVIEEGKLTY